MNKAGIAYGQVYYWLVGASFTKPCAGDGTIWTCDLSRPGGYQGRIAWDTARSYDTRATSKYSVGNQFSEYRDLNGYKTKITGGTVQIGSKPILLQNGDPARERR
jgi:hypothetical protein